MKIRSWMIVRADGSIRINSKNPAGRLSIDEISVPIEVNIPDAWGKTRQASIVIDMPEPPTVVEQVAS